jgi:hypothetical protein
MDDKYHMPIVWIREIRLPDDPGIPAFLFEEFKQEEEHREILKG